MELTQQQLAEVVAQFESVPEPQDVRRAPRVAIRRHVSILADAEHHNDEKAVVLQDISRRGISLTYHEAMARGKRFLLRLPVKGQAMELPCVVCNCEMVKQHLFRIGAAFEALTRN
jgi:hypothetical protein